MKLTRFLCLAIFVSIFVPVIESFGGEETPPAGKVRVLLVTGGHDFERERFFKFFDGLPGISTHAVAQSNFFPLLKPAAAKEYDAVVLYNYNQQINPEEQADFLARLKEGKGLVILHHAVVAYPRWPEFVNILGAKYYLAATNVNGVEKKRSAFKHGVEFRVHVEDPASPVTEGISDFTMLDEVYKWYDVSPEVHPLLSTDEAESNHLLAWSKMYGPARVVFIQSGHDHTAWDNPNFSRLVTNAIRWCAKK